MSFSDDREGFGSGFVWRLADPDADDCGGIIPFGYHVSCVHDGGLIALACWILCFYLKPRLCPVDGGPFHRYLD